MTTWLATPTWQLDGWAGNALDDFGVAWVVEEEDGWSSSPPVRTSTEEREQDDGAYDADSYYGARLITLAGRAVAPDQAGMVAAKQRLAKVMVSLRGLKWLMVTEADVTRWAAVRRGADVKIKDQGNKVFSWQLQLLAPDPRKYSASWQAAVGLASTSGGWTPPLTFPLVFTGAAGTSGIVTITNAGNYAMRPVLRILGPVSDPVLENITTGRRLMLTGLVLNAGDYVDVDMDARTVTLNGSASRRGNVAAGSDWWTLEPGDNAVRFGASSYNATAQLQVTAASTWV